MRMVLECLSFLRAAAKRLRMVVGTSCRRPFPALTASDTYFRLCIKQRCALDAISHRPPSGGMQFRRYDDSADGYARQQPGRKRNEATLQVKLAGISGCLLDVGAAPAFCGDRFAAEDSAGRHVIGSLSGLVQLAAAADLGVIVFGIFLGIYRTRVFGVCEADRLRVLGGKFLQRCRKRRKRDSGGRCGRCCGDGMQYDATLVHERLLIDVDGNHDAPDSEIAMQQRIAEPQAKIPLYSLSY